MIDDTTKQQQQKFLYEKRESPIDEDEIEKKLYKINTILDEEIAHYLYFFSFIIQLTKCICRKMLVEIRMRGSYYLFIF